MTNEPSISVVVVLYNSARLLGQCVTPIADLLRAGFAELILVDNDSRDDPSAALEELSVPYELIRTGANLGFASAVNIGARVSRAPNILLLNPDVEFDTETLIVLNTVMTQDRTIGGIAPLLETEGIQTANGGRQPNLWPMFAHATGVARQIRRWAPNAGHYLYVDSVGRRRLDVEWLSGGFLLLRREAMTEGVLLSERWFMYAEDIDVSNYIRQAGWRLVLCGDVRAYHAIGGSSDDAPSEIRTMWIRNLEDYYKQVLARSCLSGWVWRLLVSGGYVARALLALLQSRTMRRRSMWAYGKAIWTPATSKPAAVRESHSPRSNAATRQSAAPVH